MLLSTLLSISEVHLCAQSISKESSPEPETSIQELRKWPAHKLAEKYLASPPVPPMIVNRLREMGDRSVIPQLRRAFSLANDDIEKQIIAAALIGLGDRDDVSYQYLKQRAQDLLKRAIPTPMDIPKTGKDWGKTAKFSPDFLDWVRTHGANVNDAGYQGQVLDPATMKVIASAGDSRFEPVLLRALRLPNVFIIANAAKGLAVLHDEKYVRPIVEVCETSKPLEADIIVQALFYFDTPEANSAIERFLLSKEIEGPLRLEAKKNGWRFAAGLAFGTPDE